MQRVGLHIRTDGSLLDLVDKAVFLQLPFFQCFFISSVTNTRIRPTGREIREFAHRVQQHFSTLYVHGSYWINLASLQHTGLPILRKELELARRLAFTHIVLHPGTAKGASAKIEGIDALARILNELHETDQKITIVLENTAHDHLAVGSDLTDFALLLSKLDKPEMVKFCIDTAHAHAFGYDLITPQGQQDFITLVDQTVGISRVQLIHLNDTTQPRGSYIDRHAVLGNGMLGVASLKAFVSHPQLAHIPIIMELPVLSVDAEQELVQSVGAWF
jgi:deoxyribonuclease-4